MHRKLNVDYLLREKLFDTMTYKSSGNIGYKYYKDFDGNEFVFIG